MKPKLSSLLLVCFFVLKSPVCGVASQKVQDFINSKKGRIYKGVSK